MRVAFLFRRCYDYYGPDFDVLRQLMPDELSNLDTLVRVGDWGFLPNCNSTEEAARQVMSLFYNGEGAIFRLDYEFFIEAALNSTLYTVQFMSIERRLARKLDQRLASNDEYVGFGQVLPHLRIHREVFARCIPRYKIENGEIYVLYSSTLNDDEWLANEIIQYSQDTYSNLENAYLSSAISTRDIGDRFSVFDAQEDPVTEYAVDSAIRALAEEWEVQSEISVYTLVERAPHAVEELVSAAKLLQKQSLTTSDVRSISLSIRNTIEEITRSYYPNAKEGREWVKKAWETNLAKLKDDEKNYRLYIMTEVTGLDDAVNRIEASILMANKGVHEHWEPRIFRGIVLRLVLLIHELVALRPGHRVVKRDQRFFDQIFDDNSN